MSRTLWLGGHRRSRHQLTLSFGVDELCFHTTYWYGDVDLPALEERYGQEVLDRLYFHIAAFEANKLCSLRPEIFDPGPYARFCTGAFKQLWRTVVRNVWAQWRYEHDDPDYAGPELPSVADPGPAALEVDPGENPVLAFCGGGKDSLVALKLLERSHIVFDTLAYSSSVYGRAGAQHQLIDRLIDHTSAGRRRKLWMLDDFVDSPVLDLHPELGVRTVTTAETPSSVFAALPLALAHGYRWLVVAHERSADFGNLVWKRTGEEVNHQWGKSLEAERLLASYVRENLLGEVRYFSLLKPIYDVLIFRLLAADAEAVEATHSCNEQKPWCRRCPKCAYVWLGYMAYLPPAGKAATEALFGGENQLDVEENQIHFRRMLGLEDHTPFECIGTIEEARLAFELCRRKGLGGRAMETFKTELPAIDPRDLASRFLEIDMAHSLLPAELKPKIEAQFRAAAQGF